MRDVLVPTSTYRLQFNARFTFADATQLVPYLDALGITDCYASPLLKAAGGSEHGYDITDHRVLSPALGSDADFDAFASALNDRGMGLIVDFVPNHMGLDPMTNRWWRDVLQHGRNSPFADYFDIDWEPITPELKNRVLLPILEHPYAEVLHRGELQLRFVDGELQLQYGERLLPVEPQSSASVLRDPAERVDAALARFNGTPDRPETFDALHALLDEQPYRLAHWKTAFDEINYRRFFDVNQLGALRMEDPRVFDAAHARLLQLIAERKVTGIRVDHPDGLLDPGSYFTRLQAAIADVVPHLGTGEDESPRGFYIVAEKILANDEQLPADWPIAGTTGYGFLNAVNRLFVESGNRDLFISTYTRVTGRRESFPEAAYHGKRLVMGSSMASELAVLARALKSIAESDRRTRDFTLTALRKAIVEVVACFPVYRTYVNASGFSATDRETIDFAVDTARRRNPVMAPAVFLFLRNVLLAGADEPADVLAARRQFAMKFQQFSAPVQAKGVEDTSFFRYNLLLSLNEVGGDPSRFGGSPDEFHAGNQVRLDRWPLELLAGATHDTKWGEDARARLNVLSEMPTLWRRMVSAWRKCNASVRTPVDQGWAPDANDEYLFYQTLIASWPADAIDGPVPGEAPPELITRLQTHMRKAIKEAKTHTSWINQNTAYDDAVMRFVSSSLTGSRGKAFLSSFFPFMKRVATAGMTNSLAQLVLRLASPGVSDIYQGTETWQLDMADPDNRRPVDFAARRAMLELLMPSIACAETIRARPDADSHRGPDLEQRVGEWLAGWTDARIKLFVAACGLRFRRQERMLFTSGDYVPLVPQGPAQAHVAAFARSLRNRTIVAAVPRLMEVDAAARDVESVSGFWQGTHLVLPNHLSTDPFVHVFTGASVTTTAGAAGAQIHLDDLFRTCPVALLTSPLER